MHRRTLRRGYSLVLFVLLLLIPPTAHAQDGQVALLTVFVNESRKGEVPLLVRDQDLLVPTSSLAALGLETIAASGSRETIDDRQYVSLASLAPDATYQFDELDLSVRLQVDSLQLASTTVDLHRSAPDGIEYAQDTSFYLNYAPRLLDLHTFDGYAEAGLSVRGTLLWSSASMRPDGRVVRGLTNLTFDDRAAMHRWVVGDNFSSAGVLGGGAYAGGVTLSRNFDLDPYFVRGPSFGLAATALTPSTLDVYVNGVLVRQEQVEPGPVRVENLPLQSGTGVATYVLRDVFGNSQTEASPYYISNGVLRPGLSEYTYTVGLTRENAATESFSYEKPIALARYRVGATDAMTIGGRVEVGAGVASAGSTLTAVTPVGLLDFAAGASGAHGNKPGAAWAFSWGYQNSPASLGLALRGMTDRYATVSLQPGDDRAVLEVNAHTSLSISRGVSLGTRHALTQYRDAGLLAQMSLFGNFRVASGATLVSTATRTALPGGKTGNDFLMTFIVSLGRATSAQVSTHVQSDGHDEVITSVNRSRPRGIGAGYRATAAYANDTIDRAQVTGEAAGAYGVYSARYDLESAPADPQAPRRSHLTLSTQGAIVFVPGIGLFATRPVQQAIGVVRVPGVPGVRGYLNNQEVGRTDGNGNLLVPDLMPYYGNKLSIADVDLPLAYSIERTERLVAPPPRGAAVAVFDARRVLFYRGIVVVSVAGRDVVPSYGSLLVTDRGKVLESPIGDKGEMELEGLSAGEYPAQILYEGGQCDFQLRVPDGPGPVIDIGKKKCVVP
jgi:outer membrane usher protein